MKSEGVHRFLLSFRFDIMWLIVLLPWALMAEPVSESNLKKATFAGGCFWCVEEAFDGAPGVVKATVGYTGGTKENPTYEEVSSGATGHTESLQVEYDPNIINYEHLLDIFWKNIDPTVENKQFCDIGTQYRTEIFYHDNEQKMLAEKSKEKWEKLGRFKRIYTKITPASAFYPAENYHQNYHEKNPFRYKIYKRLCGREQRLEEVWGK